MDARRWPLKSDAYCHSGYMYDTPKNPYSVEHRGAFHLRRLAGNVAGKLGNAYLRYQNR